MTCRTEPHQHSKRITGVPGQFECPPTFHSGSMKKKNVVPLWIAPPEHHRSIRNCIPLTEAHPQPLLVHVEILLLVNGAGGSCMRKCEEMPRYQQPLRLIHRNGQQPLRLIHTCPLSQSAQ